MTCDEPITVGIIDSGIDVNNTDLHDAIHERSANFYFDNEHQPSSNDRPYTTGMSELQDIGYMTDDASHGTHVSGIVGALANGTGMVGSAPGVRILTLKRDVSLTLDKASAYEGDAVYYSIGLLGDLFYSRFENDFNDWPADSNWQRWLPLQTRRPNRHWNQPPLAFPS